MSQQQISLPYDRFDSGTWPHPLDSLLEEQRIMLNEKKRIYEADIAAEAEKRSTKQRKLDEVKGALRKAKPSSVTEQQQQKTSVLLEDKSLCSVESSLAALDRGHVFHRLPTSVLLSTDQQVTRGKFRQLRDFVLSIDLTMLQLEEYQFIGDDNEKCITKVKSRRTDAKDKCAFILPSESVCEMRAVGRRLCRKHQRMLYDVRDYLNSSPGHYPPSKRNNDNDNDDDNDEKEETE